MKTIAQEIAALREMTVAELKERYRELHGREPRVKNRDWLWKRCAWKVQEQPPRPLLLLPWQCLQTKAS